MKRTTVARLAMTLTMTGAMILFSACGSRQLAPDMDPTARENAIFNCKKQMEDLKKERFQTLPKILQRLAGENQVLKEFDRPPSKGDISRAIAKYPLAGDSGGTWGSEKEAHLRTISTRFATTMARPKDPDAAKRVEIGDPEMLSMVFGQPGRVYLFPLAKLKSIGGGSVAGTSQIDQLKIKVLDEHHVLIEATSSANQTKASRTKTSGFHSDALYAVVRTYLEQSYNEESANQLSNYPIDGPGLDEDICDQQVDL